MSAFSFYGRLDTTPRPPELAAGLPDLVIQPKHSGDVQRARSGQTANRIDPAADDIIELELDDGLRIWVRAEDVERDFGLSRSRGADGVLELPAVLPIGGSSRGLGGWVVKGLRVFGVDIAGAITDFVAKRVEGRLDPGPGLYRCTDGSPSKWRQASGRLSADGPTLVLLHGTASSTDGSFGALWKGGAEASIQRLLAHYDGRVLALQHRTLTQSPIENALDLAHRLGELLPAGAELHLLSHSRGGLIGELLARGMRVGAAPFDKEDFDLFSKAHARDAKALRELRDALTRSRFRIGRFVRVACPARGTSLADGRLDRYFGVITNLVGMIPLLRANPIYQGLTGLLAAVLKKRTEPDELPGLEAMMPGSALVRLLNRPGVQTEADLHVVGGDLDGAGPWERLKTLASDYFYGEDHDLVVNTPSMLGGIERAAGVIPYWIDTGGEVTHFHYFERADTTARVLSALTSSGPSADFHELSDKPFAVTAASYQKRAAAAQPVVFVVPGIMGSALSLNASRVWVDIPNLAVGGLARLAIDAPNVTADALVAQAYENVLGFLATTHEVVPFPYDWRRSIVIAAEALRADLDWKLGQAEKAGQPVRIVAHSLGGLVVRAMIGTPRGYKTWQRLCAHPGGRLVMLGTPNGGSHAIAAMLLGRDALTKKLALVDLRHSYAELLRVIARFDGVLELLPHDGSVDLFDAATWTKLFEADVPAGARGLFSSSSVASSEAAGFAWTPPDAARLAAARKVRDLLQGSPIDPARMIYVAGHARETPLNVAIDPSAKDGRHVRVEATWQGDGRVRWETGIPRQLLASQTYYMDAEHGDLANAKEHFVALHDLLVSGATTKLPRTPPAARGGLSDACELHVPAPAFVPDAEDLAATAMGGRGPRWRAPAARRVQVRVVHENLARAQSPVVVGHYEQDILASAESYLDRQLEGRLGEVYRMGLYAGRLGTATAVLNETQGAPGIHPGAVVVGLGLVGDLTPGALERTLSDGLTTYGAERSGQERRRRQRQARAGEARATTHASVTTVLIGSGAAGVTLLETLRAILNAVRHANERLRRAGETDARGAATSPLVQIDRVDIFELYEDRAIEAVRALLRLAEAVDVRDGFEVEEVLIEGQDGERRASFEEPTGWWRRIRIGREEDGSFKFEATTDRARAAGYLRPAQQGLVDRLLRRASRSTATDPELGYTLFEHMVPPDFKAYAPERRPLALMLDPKAAELPWELIHDRYDVGARPLSVETGMIRQLLIPGQPTTARPVTDCALVIGNPLVHDARFPVLGGAEDEARAVTAALRERAYGDVALLVGQDADPESVLVRLHEKPWRILHVAAHGVFDFKSVPDAPSQTGIVLDDGIVLGPEEFKQLRVAPELAFINCCHLGQTSGDAEGVRTGWARLAANVATQLIAMGTRVVIAAGWAVDDAAARTFAQTFYAEMLGGMQFGAAVTTARARVYQEHGHTNTWGAYQCYGDPGFTLRTRPDGETSSRPIAAREALIELESIAQQGKQTPTDTQRREQRQRLDGLIRGYPELWLQAGSMCAAIGAAYGALGHFKGAIEFYERAARAERGDVTLAAIEQLANLLARSENARAADALLRPLVRIGKTSERYALIGGLEKRRVLASKGAAQRKALRAMVQAYGEAHRIKVENRAADAWYPLLNKVAGEVVLSWRQVGRRAKPAGIPEDLRELRRLADTAARSGAGFWELALAGDVLLLEALSQRRLDAKAAQQIEEVYRRAILRGASATEAQSVLEQLRFFETALEAAPKPVREGLAPGLRTLRESLDAKPA